jgi:hypothetical protein
MSSTARFGLPLLMAGQAQKEITHNEALTLVDALLQPCAESAGTNAPPDDPAAGQMWIVGGAPAGAWAGCADMLAIWTDGGWRFIAPRDGTSVYVRDQDADARHVGGGWRIGSLTGVRLVVAGEQVVAARQAAVTVPAGGTVADLEARAAIGAVLDALRAHGLIAP